MKNLLTNILRKTKTNELAYAHCDGPCGVYDPASARIAGEAVLSMTKKLLEHAKTEDKTSAAYLNKFARFVSIKEQEAEKVKHELMVLWADYFKPQHLEEYPELHTLFWNAIKTASACKHEVSEEHANELMDYLKQVHELFWKTKNKDVPWTTAS